MFRLRHRCRSRPLVAAVLLGLDDTLTWSGPEAQRRTIEAFAAARGAEVLARFTEVESGKHSDRPELRRALHLARVIGATLLIAKLDRLPRNAAFLLALRDSGARFVAVDLPEANDLTLGILALVAQQDRKAISRRTKETLAIAKARGVKLGNPNGAAALRRAGQGGAPLRAAVARNADRHAADLAEVIADIQASGALSLRAIAAELNAHRIVTRRGGQWQVSNVRNLLERIGRIHASGRLSAPSSWRALALLFPPDRAVRVRLGYAGSAPTVPSGAMPCPRASEPLLFLPRLSEPDWSCPPRPRRSRRR